MKEFQRIPKKFHERIHRDFTEEIPGPGKIFELISRSIIEGTHGDLKVTLEKFLEKSMNESAVELQADLL